MSTDTERRDARESLSLAVVVGLFIALFGSPVLGLLDISERMGMTTTGSLVLNAAIMWLLVASVVAIVRGWENRSLESIGVEAPTRRQVTVGVGAGVLGLVGGLVATGIAVTAFQLEQPAALSRLAALSLPVKLVIVGTAVVTEEVLWRGYPIERLTELTGSIRVGAATSAIVFLAVHYPAWGLVGAIPQAVFTLAIVGVYVRTRNLGASILTHAVINVAMVLLLPTFL